MFSPRKRHRLPHGPDSGSSRTKPAGPGSAGSPASGDVRRWVDWLMRRSRLVIVVCTLLALVAGVRTVLTYSNLKSDLEELLPATAPSVVALDRARQRLSGLRHLGVVVDAGSPQNIRAAMRFLYDLEA